MSDFHAKDPNSNLGLVIQFTFIIIEIKLSLIFLEKIHLNICDRTGDSGHTNLLKELNWNAL